MRRSGGDSTILSRPSAESDAVSRLANFSRAWLSMPRIMGLSSIRRTLTVPAMALLRLSFRLCSASSGAAVIAALATGFALQYDVANFDSLIQRFAHVVNGKRGDTGGDQRFHLDSGYGGCAGGSENRNAILAHGNSDINVG